MPLVTALTVSVAVQPAAGGNRDLQCGGVAVLDGRGADLGAVDRGDQLGLGGHAQRGERELRELQIERGAGRDLATRPGMPVTATARRS